MRSFLLRLKAEAALAGHLAVRHRVPRLAVLGFVLARFLTPADGWPLGYLVGCGAVGAVFGARVAAGGAGWAARYVARGWWCQSVARWFGVMLILMPVVLIAAPWTAPGGAPGRGLAVAATAAALAMGGAAVAGASLGTALGWIGTGVWVSGWGQAAVGVVGEWPGLALGVLGLVVAAAAPGTALER